MYLSAFWATQMEAGLVYIQANIVMIGDFDHTIQRHGLGFLKCFLTTYWNYMVGDNCGLANIHKFGLGISHPSFFKNKGTLVVTYSIIHYKWGHVNYWLQHIWISSVVNGHLPTHVHSQCLIMLMVGRRRCLVCRAPIPLAIVRII